MNQETKVGLFVLAGLLIAGLGIVKVTDVHFRDTYRLYLVFKDVQGIRMKSLIKISGVEVGRVKKVELYQGQAKITAEMNGDVPVYADARVRVRLIGFIGTQFIDMIPGAPESPRLKGGDTIRGDSPRSINDLVEKLADLVEGKGGKPGIGEDLAKTVRNVRSITDALNEAIGSQKEELSEIVTNFHQFTEDLKGAASDLKEVTASNKETVRETIEKLRSILERLDTIVASVQKGEGAAGRLISDKEMGDEVKKTVTHLKQTAESAKDVLARFTKFRTFWELELRAAPGANTARGDAGVRLQPRENKYYYLGVHNAGDRKDEFRDAGDYEKKNTVTAVLGKEFGAVTLEAGAIRSSAGIGLKYYPFKEIWPAKEAVDGTGKLELNAQAFEFGRDETRGRAGQERKFSSPQLNLGTKYKVNRWMRVGAAVEDLTEARQYNLSTHLIFEDRDLAYLFGFVSFAR
ncbi:MAG: MCE family protein [Elusimicrobia bacterium]|nr:MCE family protein [Elusimicrobiota bacterium]